jgi:hypothetical protein
LTATIAGGALDADNNPVDYAEDFGIAITNIRKVTNIVNAPTNALVNIPVNLGGAAVLPVNATNKTIVWSVKTAGAGVTTISGNAFTPAATGTVTLTATIVDGDEDAAGVHDYTQDFTITVDTQPSPAPGNVGMGDDTTIELYANAGTTPLDASAATVVAKDSTYYLRVNSAYANIVWYLNGRPSTATGNRLYLDTSRTGTVKVTVEATRNGAVDTGSHTFRIE